MLVIGVQSTVSFFFQAKKWKGTTCFLGGILLVLIGWPIIGILVELFGFINLFGNFFPNVLRVASRLPIIGNILQNPVISDVSIV